MTSFPSTTRAAIRYGAANPTTCATFLCADRAVARVDDIARAEGVHHSARDRLLADRKMDEPRDLARADELGDALLEGAEQPHAPEERATDRSWAGGQRPPTASTRARSRAARHRRSRGT